MAAAVAHVLGHHVQQITGVVDPLVYSSSVCPMWMSHEFNGTGPRGARWMGRV
jgi:hypothetical protein